MGRVAIVTGAGNGLGAAIATALYQAGYKVGIADRDVAAARDTARSLDASGQAVRPIELDVRDKSAFLRAREELVEQWQDVHVLVNNAAVTVTTPVMDISPEEFNDVLTVNLRGTFLGCQVFGSYFQTRGHGRIINIASLAGQNGGTATGAHYAAAKGGVLTLTKVFARELARHGVTVNAISPGPLDLPVVRRTVTPERLDEIIRMIPMGELGDPAFVARLVVQLASAEASSATGATWDLNGGLFMR